MSRSLRRVLTLLFVGVFLLSLAANVALLRQSRHYKRLFYLTRLDPLGLAAFAGKPSAAEPGVRRVVLFGDSRVAAWSLPTPAGVQIVNRGVAGHSSTQALLRFAEHVAPLRPDVVVVQVGVNDLVAVPLLPQDRAQIVAATRRNIAAIVAEARSLGAAVVLTTIIPPARAALPNAELQQAIAEVNGELLGLVGDGVQILDSATLLVGSDGYLLPAYAADELHLSAAGYAALNAAMVPLLAEPRIDPER